MLKGAHYNLTCPDCGKPILIPLEMLSQAFQDLIRPSKDIEPIVAVCAHCKRVRNYDLARKSQSSPWGPMVYVPDSGWASFGWLKCEGETCEFRITLFAKWNPKLSPAEQEEEQEKWDWKGLKCPAGHTIPKPARDPESGQTPP
jgi:hypothetical protein